MGNFQDGYAVKNIDNTLVTSSDYIKEITDDKLVLTKETFLRTIGDFLDGTSTAWRALSNTLTSTEVTDSDATAGTYRFSVYQKPIEGDWELGTRVGEGYDNLEGPKVREVKMHIVERKNTKPEIKSRIELMQYTGESFASTVTNGHLQVPEVNASREFFAQMVKGTDSVSKVIYGYDVSEAETVYRDIQKAAYTFLDGFEGDKEKTYYDKNELAIVIDADTHAKLESVNLYQGAGSPGQFGYFERGRPVDGLLLGIRCILIPRNASYPTMKWAVTTTGQFASTAGKSTTELFIETPNRTAKSVEVYSARNAGYATVFPENAIVAVSNADPLPQSATIDTATGGAGVIDVTYNATNLRESGVLVLIKEGVIIDYVPATNGTGLTHQFADLEAGTYDIQIKSNLSLTNVEAILAEQKDIVVTS